MDAWDKNSKQNVMTKKFRNKYYILRHGEALANVKGINSSWPEKFENNLTSRGRKQIEVAAKKLSSKNIDVVIASDLLRTKQTSQIVAKKLKLKVHFDKGLREIDFGNFNGAPAIAAKPFYDSLIGGRRGAGKAGETYREVLSRVYGCFKKIDKKYKGKIILLVSHQAPLWILQNKIDGFPLEHGVKRIPKSKRIGRGEVRELN